MTDEQEKRMTALFSWAQDQGEAGNWSGAIQTLDRLLDLDPEHKAAQELRARAEVEQARVERLARLYDQAQERLQVGDWDRAITICEEISIVDPHYRDACTLMEQAQQAQKKLDEVTQTYRTAQLSFETGEWPTAVEMFKQVADTDPAYRDAQAKLELAQAELERHAELEEQYQTGLKHIQRRQWAEAVAILEQVVTDDESFAQGRAEERLAEAKSALEREQAETVARLYDAGAEYARKGEWALAAEALEQVLEHDPEYPDAKKLLEEARERRDDELQAQDLYEIGVQHAQRGNWSEAAAAFEEVLDLRPGYRDAERRLQSAR
ncbi:MAG: tetratricopeptide repeat protein, partial [Chloroflexi bacterium]|nr:tetratricopeptide repeat protein [Chloroflexota bacterium]